MFHGSHKKSIHESTYTFYLDMVDRCEANHQSAITKMYKPNNSEQKTHVLSEFHQNNVEKISLLKMYLNDVKNALFVEIPAAQHSLKIASDYFYEQQVIRNIEKVASAPSLDDGNREAQIIETQFQSGLMTLDTRNFKLKKITEKKLPEIILSDKNYNEAYSAFIKADVTLTSLYVKQKQLPVAITESVKQINDNIKNLLTPRTVYVADQSQPISLPVTLSLWGSSPSRQTTSDINYPNNLQLDLKKF